MMKKKPSFFSKSQEGLFIKVLPPHWVDRLSALAEYQGALPPAAPSSYGLREVAKMRNKIICHWFFVRILT